MWTRGLSVLPGRAQDAIRMAYVAARITSDRESLGTFGRLMREPDNDHASSLARLRLRPLRGREVLVRPGTSDLATVWGTFARGYHLPPREIGAPSIIWDLGANIGLTMAHFACLFPRAHVLGVELDGDNVALARRNVAAWANSCEVIHAAVWRSDGEVHYRGWPGGTSNYQVVAEGGRPVRAVSLTTLMHERGGPVDYLKIDVEGAERELLRDGAGWAAHVRCVKVELHGDYDPGSCEADLRRLGFKTWLDPGHWAAVVGYRNPENFEL